MTYPNGIYSQHYFGQAFKPEEVSQISRELVNPGNNISGRKFKAPTVGSYGHAASILTQTRDDRGNPIWENRTSNNTFRSYDVPINGYYSPKIDDGAIRGNYQFSPIANWRAVSEQNQEKVCVELPPETLPGIIIESFGERKLNVGKGTPVDLFVHDYQLHGIRNNRAGPAFHRVENLRQSFMNYLGTKFAQNHYSRLASLGYKSEDIGYLAIAFVDGVFYAVGRAPDGKIALSASIGTQTELEKLAKEWGLKAEDLRMDSFAEEITHIMRGSIDRVIRGEVGLIREEIATKKMVRESYLEEEKGAEGNPEAVAYWERMAAFKQEKIDRTPADYGGLARQRLESLESIVENNIGEDTTQNIATMGGSVSKTAPISKYQSNVKRNKGDEKIIYAAERFDKGKYQDRKEAGGKDAKPESDARNGDAEASSKETGAKGESPESGDTGQGEATAEAA